MLRTAQARPLILVFPFCILSHYLRCLILCKEFKKYFEVRIAYHPSFASFIEEQKIDIFNCEALNGSSAVEAIKQFDFSWINETDLERVYLEQVRVINQYKPVAVLGDHSPTLKMAAESTSVLFISILNGYMSKYYSGHRTISRTHPLFPLLKMLPPFIERLLTKQGEATAFRQLHKPFKKIRKRFRIQSKSGYLDEMEGDINLICDLEDLFPQKRLPPNYHLIKPLIYEPPTALSDIATRLVNTKKTILVSMGSTGDWQKLYFLNDSYFEKYNIVTTGDQSRVLHAAHIIPFLFLNIHDIFPSTDLLICHGGNGTIYQALLYQIPVLCKTSHCEQEWNSHALENNQLGKNLDGTDDLDQYKKIIEEWLLKKETQHFRSVSDSLKRKSFELPQIIQQLSHSLGEDMPLTQSHKDSVDAA